LSLKEASLELFTHSAQRHLVEKLIEAANKLPLSPVKVRPPIYRGPLPSPASVASGVDGGHQVLELCGGSLIMVAAVAYTSELAVVEDRWPIMDAEVLFVGDEEPEALAEAVERRLIYRVALKALVHRAPELILIDGGLLPHPRLYQAERGALLTCVAEGAKLLMAAKQKGVDVAGVVKRSRGRLFDGVHRDVALLDLSEGEATEPKPIEEGWLRRARQVAQLAGMDLPNIEVSYVKTAQRREPLRLEVPSWVNLGKVISTILATSEPQMGLPIHIVKADVHTKVHSGVVRAVYSRLLCRMIEEHGSVAEDYLRIVRGEEVEEG